MCDVNYERSLRLIPGAETFFLFQNFIFRGSEFFGSDVLESVGVLPVGLDGAEAILSDQNYLGPVELLNSFRSYLTEEPQRVSDKWFENHYRWVVWKLAKLEQKFPKSFGGSALTPAEVMQQIKVNKFFDNSILEAVCFRSSKLLTIQWRS